MSPERWQQVEALYHAALEKEPGDRAGFLSAACAGDLDLRGEVQSLLQHSGNPDTRLDRPAWEGARLGPYEILHKLGEGGMGEVWKARDTRLDRLVAIKRSKELFSERFEREARSIAALNHPHICAVYDVAEDYLVIEYVEGVTLKGPMPLQDVVRYGGQIADALEAAHRKRIVHRDLKPANILINKQGVKLLDFGLARRIAATPGHEHAALTGPVTEAGLIAGTPHYMAPEQMEGKEPDLRSDIFAFGCVLFEMITGKRAFDGKTQASVMAAVLHVDPPSVSAIQPLASPALDRIVNSCLAKDPDERWQSARDLRHALLLASEQQVAPAARRRRTWPALAAAAVAQAAIWFLARGTFRKPALEPDPVRFVLTRPAGTVPTTGAPVAVSPDGRMVATVERSANGKNYVWLYQLGTGSTRRLDTTEGAGDGANANVTGVFWSPDNKSVAFYSDGKLKRVAVAGGSPQVLCESCSGGGGGSWNRNGVILFSGTGTLYQIPALGGKPTVIAAPNKSLGEGFSAPHFLPDGRHFLYRATHITPAKAGIFLQELGSPATKRLVESRAHAQYAEPGYLLFAQDGTLFGQRLRLANFQLQGDPAQIAGEVEEPFGFSVSENGVLAYRSVYDQNQQQPFWYDRSGKRTPASAEHGYSTLRLAPDGTRAVLLRRDSGNANGEFWVLELARGTLSRIMLDPSITIRADGPWSPDSRQIAFLASVPGGVPAFHTVSVSSGATRVLLEQAVPQRYPKDWSRDNRFLAYHFAGRLDTTLYLLPVAGGASNLLIKMRGLADGFRFSPDGRWIAYASNDSGKYEVYVAPLSAPSDRRQISSDGGVQPIWRQDGRELFYLTQQGKLMSVDLTPGPAPKPGIPKLLFQTNAFSTYNRTVYAVAENGKRFLILEPETRAAGDVNVILHWDADLRER